jgi:hypothetical protein
MTILARHFEGAFIEATSGEFFMGSFERNSSCEYLLSSKFRSDWTNSVRSRFSFQGNGQICDKVKQQKASQKGVECTPVNTLTFSV